MIKVKWRKMFDLSRRGENMNSQSIFQVMTKKGLQVSKISHDDYGNFTLPLQIFI